MKGIVLAGGTGSRLWPVTRSVSKQLLPVYDKPMIYYPISTLMMAGIREILIITTPQDKPSFQQLLGNGGNLGIKFEFAVQEKPEGLAQSFLIGREFLNGSDVVLILGDNIFHGSGLGHELRDTFPNSGAHIFTYNVTNPSDYGVLTIDNNGVPFSIDEKPINPKSNMAVTGLYYFDKQVTDIAKNIKPSLRGELEITSVIEHYLKSSQLTFTQLSRGVAWLDTGNPNSLSDASNYVRVIEHRTGLRIGCLEEIAFTNGWINSEKVLAVADSYGSSEYGRYLKKLVQ
jgi:glucose-1-phosphate thymidylyltransferase